MTELKPVNRLVSAELEGPLFRKYGVELEEGSYLFRENELGREMYILLSGKISIRQQLSDGGVQELALLDGDVHDESAEQSSSRVIGEMSILESRPRSADAFAVSRCRLIRVDDPTFYSMLRNSAQFSLEFMKVLSHRLRVANQMRQRMASELNRFGVRMRRIATAALTAVVAGADRNQFKLTELIAKVIDDPSRLSPDLAVEGLKWLESREIVKIEGGLVIIVRPDLIRAAAYLTADDE